MKKQQKQQKKEVAEKPKLSASEKREEKRKTKIVEELTPIQITYSASELKLLEEFKKKAANLEYPPPENKMGEFHFVKHWLKYHDSMAESNNFKMSHLVSLEMLCDLHEKKEFLEKIIRERGMTYECDGRYGRQAKERPEVNLLEKINLQILKFQATMKLVGPSKDGQMHDNIKGKTEWL